MRKFIAYLIICLLFASCNRKEAFKREIVKMDKEVYYGKYSDKNKVPIVDLYIAGIDQAFNLPPISNSEFEKEVRVYYQHSFGETFFRQRFKNGLVYAELYVCNTTRREDSLFMHIENVIKTHGSYEFDNSLSLNALNKDTFFLTKWADTSDVLHNTSDFFVQIYKNHKSKYVLIEGPCRYDYGSNKEVAKNICDLTNEIQTNFTFRFGYRLNKMLDSAFINPYHLIAVPALKSR